jgi:hypothetical protein
VRKGHELSEASICTAFDAVIFIFFPVLKQDCKVNRELMSNKKIMFFMILF